MIQHRFSSINEIFLLRNPNFGSFRPIIDFELKRKRPRAEPSRAENPSARLGLITSRQVKNDPKTSDVICECSLSVFNTINAALYDQPKNSKIKDVLEQKWKNFCCQNFSSKARIDDLRVKSGESDYTITVSQGPYKYYVSMFLAFLGPPTYVSINNTVNGQNYHFLPHPPLC